MRHARLLLLALLGCDTPAEDSATPAEPSVIVQLEGAELARRISLDLRGVTPTLDELERAEADGVDDLVDEWLEDERFEERLVDAFAEDWLLRIDELRIEPREFNLDVSHASFTRAFGDEPAHLMARIAAEDLSWNEVVQADWTVSSDLLAEMVPLEFVGERTEQEWRKARYTDGRPAIGVLASSGLWVRYHTTLVNYNRRRAWVLANYLLCYDFLARPVSFAGVTVSNSDELQAATQTVDGCVSCHSGLDPLASALFGFWPFEDKDGIELVTYHLDRELYGETVMGLSPGYFGTPVDAVSQLGGLIANDPRFSSCAVESAARRYWARNVDYNDLDTLEALEAEFEDADRRYKALVKAVFATEEYRAGNVTEDATDEDIDRIRTTHQLSALQIASAVEDLTGFRWEFGDWDMLDSDEQGYRLLLGGADGLTVRESNYAPTVARSITLNRVGEAAGAYVVAQDAALDQAERRLLGTTTEDPLTLTVDDPELATEITTLHTRILGRAPTDEEVDELVAFWGAATAAADEESAWAGLIAILLQDPGFWSY